MPTLEVNIRGDPNEIAALVLAVQGRQDKSVQFVDTPGIPNPLDTITESFRQAIDGIAQVDRFHTTEEGGTLNGGWYYSSW